VIYSKPENEPIVRVLSATWEPGADRETIFRFRAEAFAAAMNKARELGWIVQGQAEAGAPFAFWRILNPMKKETAEEKAWRKEFEEKGLRAVERELHLSGNYPGPKRQFCVRWLREKERGSERQAKLILLAAIVSCIIGIAGIALTLFGPTRAF
jgi:hypothetical protein